MMRRGWSSWLTWYFGTCGKLIGSGESSPVALVLQHDADGGRRVPRVQRRQSSGDVGETTATRMVGGQAARVLQAAFVPLGSVPLRRNRTGRRWAAGGGRRAKAVGVSAATHGRSRSQEWVLPSVSRRGIMIRKSGRRSCANDTAAGKHKQGPSHPARTAISVRRLCGRGGMRYAISVRRCIAPGTSYSLGSRGSITRPEVIDPRRG